MTIRKRPDGRYEWWSKLHQAWMTIPDEMVKYCVVGTSDADGGPPWVLRGEEPEADTPAVVQSTTPVEV